MKKILIGLGVIVFIYIFLNPYYLFPDGQGYFSYLPSLFYDGDLQLYNEFVNMQIPVPLALTDTGYISNNWQIGASFLWSPFYLAGRLFAETGTLGHDAWYWFWVNFSTMFYGILALLLLFKIADIEKFKSRTAVSASACAIFGTPALFYIFIIQSNASGLTAFTSALFIWYWLHSMKEQENPRRYILLGLILGVAAMVRSQETLLGLAPAAEFAYKAAKKHIKPLPAVKYAALAVVSFAAGFSPQLLSWKIINGSFFAAPAAFNLSLDYFALDKVLFSSYHGILFWTPVYLIALAGLILGMRSNPVVNSGLLLVFLAQLLVNSCIAAFWEGYSFGLRQMTGLFPVIFLGTAEYLKYLEGKNRILRIAGAGILAAAVLWTAGLTAGYFSGLDLLMYVPVKGLLAAQVKALAGLAALPGKLLALRKVEFGSYAVMTATGLLMFWFSGKIMKYMQKKKTYFAVGCILAILAAFNIILVKAALNKPAYQIPEEQTVTQQELDGFFMKQIEDIKKTFKD